MAQKRCFVIMPFSKTTPEHTKEYWDKHYEKFLKPHIEECGNLKAHRSEALRGDILRDIITNLVKAPIVVADLTDYNSNVFWELGVRQSFAHGTITIAETGTKLPFDIGVKSTLNYYPKDHLKNEEFCRQFKKAIEDCITNPEIPDSHVLETLSGRGTLFEILQHEESIRKLDAVLSEYNRNLYVFKNVLNNSKINQKKPDVRTYTTLRFRISGIELLITNRYLDESKQFYNLAEQYYDDLRVLNDQLGQWEQFEDITEKWFLESEKSTMKSFSNFKEALDPIIKKLEERI